MKTIIVYESTHHGNTKKIVDAISEKFSIKTVSIEKIGSINFDEYDTIGIASGVAFARFYKRTENFVQNILPPKKKVFFIYTYGGYKKMYVSQVTKNAIAKNCEVLGEYGSKGFDTFGPLKLIGGVNKNHPTEKEISNALEWFEKNVKNIGIN